MNIYLSNGIERYRKVLEQHILPSRRCIFQRGPCVFLQEHAKPHTAAITTAWLPKSPGAELACLQSRSFTYRRTFGTSLNKKYVKDDLKLFSSWKPLSGKNGTKFQHQNSRNS